MHNATRSITDRRRPGRVRAREPEMIFSVLGPNGPSIRPPVVHKGGVGGRISVCVILHLRGHAIPARKSL